VYWIHVGYYDLRTGVSRFEVLVNGEPVATWSADDTLPPAVVDEHLDGHTATRFTKLGVRLNTGDVVEVRGVPSGAESAPLDFLQIVPERLGELPVF
jgi:alpha-glucuronidase